MIAGFDGNGPYSGHPDDHDEPSVSNDNTSS
jgi:hypothetical protein